MASVHLSSSRCPSIMIIDHMGCGRIFLLNLNHLVASLSRSCLFSSICTGQVLVAPSAVAVAIVQDIIAYHCIGWNIILIVKTLLFILIQYWIQCHHDCRPPTDTCTGSRPTPQCNLSQTPRRIHTLLQIQRSKVTSDWALSCCNLPLLIKHPLSLGPHLDH